MTGFGKSETQYNNKKITIELRTLNSKNIDLNVRTPHCYRELEAGLRKAINDTPDKRKNRRYCFCR